MTPELLEQGAQRMQQRLAALETGRSQTASGGRSSGFSRPKAGDSLDLPL